MPNFTDIQGGTQQGQLVVAGQRVANQKIKGAVTVTLTKNSPPILIFDPDTGTQKVILPLPADVPGYMFTVVNIDAAIGVNIRDAADATTVQAVAATKAATVYSDGAAWRVLSVLA